MIITRAVWKNLVIINSGYPADKTGNLVDTQWYMKGKIEKLTERKVYYYLDTYGGNSGSCVWIDDAKYQVICIYAHGGCSNIAKYKVKCRLRLNI